MINVILLLRMEIIQHKMHVCLQIQLKLMQMYKNGQMLRVHKIQRYKMSNQNILSQIQFLRKALVNTDQFMQDYLTTNVLPAVAKVGDVANPQNPLQVNKRK